MYHLEHLREVGFCYLMSYSSLLLRLKELARRGENVVLVEEARSEIILRNVAVVVKNILFSTNIQSLKTALELSKV